MLDLFWLLFGNYIPELVALLKCHEEDNSSPQTRAEQPVSLKNITSMCELVYVKGRFPIGRRKEIFVS